MEKIILTKRQGLALELLIKESNLKNVIDLVLLKISDNGVWERKELLSLNELTNKEILQSLYVGYKVEETKEERIISYIEYIEANEFTDQLTKDQKICTVLNVLNILGVEIKGVNQ